MKHWPRLHDTYIARAVVGSVLLAWGVLLGLDVVLAFAADARDVGKGGFTINHAIAATGLTIPWRAYNLFPTAAVIGALLGLGQLSASSELTALRAVGLSRRRLSVSVALSLAMLTALMVVNGETLAPWGEERAQALKSVRNKDLVVAQYSGLWAREGDMFLNARTTFGAKSVTRDKVAEERWESALDETVLAASVTKPRNMGSGELRGSIEYRKRNDLEAGEFEDIYWGRWFYPINVLALCLAAVPFAFGSLRSGGYGKRVFTGIVFALGFWMLQKMSTQVAGVFRYDYRIAYAMPPVIMLLVSYLLFKRRSG
jgi:lipopolysaccharide export system permease protein